MSLFLILGTTITSQERAPNQEVNAPPIKKAKKVYPKILDGTFYKVISDSNGKLSVECTTCNMTVNGTVTSTGNFHSHYQRKHKDEVQKLKDHAKASEVAYKHQNSRQPTINDSMHTLTAEKVCK